MTLANLQKLRRLREPGVRPRMLRKGRRLAVALAALMLPLQSATAADEPLQVVTTIKPIHSLAAQVLDGIAEPKLLIEGAQSPHVFALKPSDAAALHNADVFVRVASAVEPFTDKVITTLPSGVRVVTLLDDPKLTKLDVRSSGTFEAHHHGKDDHHDAGHEDGHHDGKDAAHAIDPHIWLDPRNAQHMVRRMVAAFSAAAPQHKKRLKANGAQAAVRLAKLEKELQEMLEPVRRVPFVVFHDAFQYFENRFGLSGAGAITLHPEAPPSAKRLNEIRATIQRVGAKCVFSEPQFNVRRIATVVEGSAAQTGNLDPLGAKVAAGPKAYESLMQHLAADLKACLTGKAGRR